jgi:hypothetical protein
MVTITGWRILASLPLFDCALSYRQDRTPLKEDASAAVVVHADFDSLLDRSFHREMPNVSMAVLATSEYTLPLPKKTHIWPESAHSFSQDLRPAGMPA